ADLRPSYPLLSAERWTALLEERGYAEVTTLPADEASPELRRLAVVVARRPGAAAAVANDWLIVADQAGVGEHLADLLREHGGRPGVLPASDAGRRAGLPRRTGQGGGSPRGAGARAAPGSAGRAGSGRGRARR